jgi:sugar phosphate permease
VAERGFKYWRKRILLTTWITYAIFYLARVNMSVAMPGIMAEFGFSKTEMGGVLTALLAMYAIGQFVNGQLGDKFGARKIITLGIMGSAAMNLIFGFVPGTLFLMILLWGLNGYFQSMGWSLSVKTIANWFPLKMRGKVTGVLGTSYQIGNAVSWLLAGFVISLLGWRYGFFVPALIFFVVGIFWYIRSRNAPEEVGLPTIEEEMNGVDGGGEIRKDEHLGFRYTLKQTLMNPGIWIVGFGLLFLNIVRYGFLSWAPTYMFEVQGAQISTAAYKAVAIPIAGSLGAIFAGYVSDKVFKSRRAPIAVIMLLLLSAFSWFYPQVPAGNWVLSFMVLIAIGFMTYGPHVLMVTTMPIDHGTRKAAASATGFIDGMGYIGASITGIGSGWLIDNFGWGAAFNFWVASGIICAILMALLWNYKPSRKEHM